MVTPELDLTDLRTTFFDEAEERLRSVEGLLLKLEEQPSDTDIIHTIFREVHSLKGGAGACQLTELAAFTHVFENLLAQMRLGALQLGAQTSSVMLQAVDVLGALLRNAQGEDTPLLESQVEAATLRLQSELAAVGMDVTLASAPRGSGAEQEALVWFDEEPEPGGRREGSAAPPPSGVQTVANPPLVSEASLEAPASPMSADGAEVAMVSIPAARLTQLVDRSVELAIAVSSLGHALGEAALEHNPRAQSLFAEVRTHSEEIQSALAEAHATERSALCDVVLVQIQGRAYFLSLAQVGQYFSIPPGTLTSVPMLGEVVVFEGIALRPLRLGPSQVSVAVTLAPELGRFALLVDEVVTQTRVIVRPLDPCLARSRIVSGAAIYAGEVVLVLNLERMSADGAAAPLRHARA